MTRPLQAVGAVGTVGPREFLMSFLHHIFFASHRRIAVISFTLTKPDPRSRCASPVFAVVVSSIWTARARPQSARLWSLEPLKVILLEYINNIDLYIIYCIYIYICSWAGLLPFQLLSFLILQLARVPKPRLSRPSLHESRHSSSRRSLPQHSRQFSRFSTQHVGNVWTIWNCQLHCSFCYFYIFLPFSMHVFMNSNGLKRCSQSSHLAPRGGSKLEATRVVALQHLVSSFAVIVDSTSTPCAALGSWGPCVRGLRGNDPTSSSRFIVDDWWSTRWSIHDIEWLTIMIEFSKGFNNFSIDDLWSIRRSDQSPVWGLWLVFKGQRDSNLDGWFQCWQQILAWTT